MVRYIIGILPRLLGSRGILVFFDVFRYLHRVIYPILGLVNRKDRQEVESEKYRRNGFYENQRAMGEIPFGRATVAYSGCEVLATFNALYALHPYEKNNRDRQAISLTELLREYERDGITLAGFTGTAPSAIRDYFIRHGYKVSMVTAEKDYVRVSEKYQTLIYVFYNNKLDIRKQIHTISVTKEQGRFFPHNVHSSGPEGKGYDSFLSLAHSLNRGQSKGIALIGISV